MPTADEPTPKEANLIYLVKDGKVLLPKKTRKIGKGRRNGYGGKPEEGETMLGSAVRELFEEAGVKANEKDLIKVAELRFKNTTSDAVDWEIVVHTYLLHEWEGEPRETEDGAMSDLQWFAFDEIPYDDMMEADRLWLPKALEGKKVVVHTHYGPHQKELLAPIEVEEVIAFTE